MKTTKIAVEFAWTTQVRPYETMRLSCFQEVEVETEEPEALREHLLKENAAFVRRRLKEEVEKA